MQPLGGVPLVVRVALQVRSHEVTDRLVVATDSPEIEAVVRQAGFEAALTSSHHASGTDRAFEVANRPGFDDFDKILNIQGDAPFVPLAALTGALRQLDLGHDLGTAAEPLEPADRTDPSRVKVAIDSSGRAVGFSRAVIQGHSNLLHVGIYAYRRAALERLARAEPVLEETEQALEQLRALALGLSIGVARIDEPAGPAIDTAADLLNAQAHWNSLHEVMS